MSLKIKILIGILVVSNLFAYFFLVNKWNNDLLPPATVHTDDAINAAAKKEIGLSYLENRDSILRVVTYPVLVYRYAQDNCGSCISEDLSELRIFQDEVAKGKIFILPAHEENQQNRIALANQLADLEYKNMPASLLVLPKDKDGFTQRYFALIDNKGNLGEVHFPERGNTAATKAYFQRVKGYFNSVNY